MKVRPTLRPRNWVATRRPAIKQNGEISPMHFEGQTLKLDTQGGGIAELRFERGVEAAVRLVGSPTVSSRRGRRQRAA
jgi:hypothetical protein